MLEPHILRYSKIVYNTVYTYEMSNAKYVHITKVTSVPFVKVASHFKPMYIGSSL